MIFIQLTVLWCLCGVYILCSDLLTVLSCICGVHMPFSDLLSCGVFVVYKCVMWDFEEHSNYTRIYFWMGFIRYIIVIWILEDMNNFMITIL